MMNKNTVDGSTALRPQRDEEFFKKQRKIEEKKRKELLNKKREEALKKKLGILLSIGILFVVSMILIMRFAFICNLRQEVTSIQKQTVSLNKENENLKVELLKYDNINYIEKVATEKLNMQRTNLGNVDYCDLEANYFKDDAKQSESKNNKKESVIEYIKSKLF